MTVALIQARMGSTRLPGKVLMDVAGKPLLQQLVDRIAPAQKLTEIIIVTTTNPEDDAIAEWGQAQQRKVFRGSDWDVLDRFYQAALSLNQEVSTIVRICADNPLHAHQVVDFVVSEYEKAEVDYFSNSNYEPDFLEDGFDVEVFSFTALEDAWKNAKLLSEREHVCPYIKKHFRCGWKKANANYQYKLSVDTPNDLETVRTIFQELQTTPQFSIDEVVNLLERKPEILEINKESVINAGYQKSLDHDRIIE